jgi:hypothetical protein
METLFTALSKSGGPATSQKKFFLGYIITFTGKMPLWRIEMRQQILDCIKKGGVSFVELQNEVEGFRGDQWIRNEKNHVYWSNISEEAAQTLINLEKENLIKKEPCAPMIYMCDGGWMPLPLVKSYRAYKKPHWLPVTYSLVK